MTIAKTIVVGTDGSETAAEAVDRAARLAAADGARLVVVTAYRGGGSNRSNDTRTDAPEEIAWQLSDRNAAERLTDRARHVAHSVGVRDVVVQAAEGDPAEVILEVAEQFSADIIVVGSVGLTSAAHFMLGSVAASVAHHAPCDVLIVHTAP